MEKRASFTDEEKQLILNKLNRKRIKKQKIEEPIKKEKLQQELEKLKEVDTPKEERNGGYTTEEKDKIFARLNRDRLQRRESKINPIKKVYSINGKDYYKFIDMTRSYYLRTDMMDKMSPRPEKVYLYYRVLGELKKREVSIRKVSYSKNLFVSISTTKLNFKEHILEVEEQKRS